MLFSKVDLSVGKVDLSVGERSKTYITAHVLALSATFDQVSPSYEKIGHLKRHSPPGK